MKKLYFLVVITFLGLMTIKTNGQPILSSGFEAWTSGTPDGWFGSKSSISADSIAQYTTSVHGGTYACKLQSGTTSHKRFTTQGLPIVAGKTYQITFWARGHGDIRTGCYKGAGNSSAAYYPYNSYITVDQLTWSEYSQFITVDTTSAIAQFIISVRNTRPDKDHLQIDDVTIDTASSVPTVKKIREIQYTTLPSGDSPLNGQNVTTTGIVTGKYYMGYFIQDSIGPWQGIFVYDTVNTLTVLAGDKVTLTGSVSEYFNLTEIKNLTSFTITSSSNPLPAFDPVTNAQVNSEPYECVLVRLQNVECTDTNAGNGMFRVYDGSDTCLVDDVLYHFSPTLNEHYNINGIGYYSFGKFKVLPRDITDISVYSIAENQALEFNLYPNPASDHVYISLTGKADLIRITNVYGQLMSEIAVNNKHSLSIDLSTYADGCYIISTINEGQSAGNKIIIKQ